MRRSFAAAHEDRLPCLKSRANASCSTPPSWWPGRRSSYFLNDHHGDGIVAVSTRGRGRERRAGRERSGSLLPAYSVPGLVVLRLDRGRVDWAEVAEIVTDGYLLAVSKRLARLVEVPRPADAADHDAGGSANATCAQHRQRSRRRGVCDRHRPHRRCVISHQGRISTVAMVRRKATCTVIRSDGSARR